MERRGWVRATRLTHSSRRCALSRWSQEVTGLARLVSLRFPPCTRRGRAVRVVW